MPEIILTLLARQDIKQIGRYSQKHFGRDQRNRYLTHLDKAIKGLKNSTRMDRRRDDIEPFTR